MGQLKMTMIQPNSTIGVLGGGQLGRMFALSARQMGYRVVVFTPESDSPAGQVADVEIRAEYSDTVALRRFGDCIDVATIEFENIPVEAMEIVSKKVPVRPGTKVLAAIQNRLAEKTFLTNNGFPVAPFRAIRTASDVASTTALEFPAVLKTAASGYDGKGQCLVASTEQLMDAWQGFGQVECVLESFVDFECEFSVIVARSNEQLVHYSPILNRHLNHILDISQSPSGLSQPTCDKAVEVARGVADALDYVGVMCVEYFLHRDGRVIINEIAPRPHNSGHLTIEAHATSQFEQQVRAVCGLPLGSTEQNRPAAMANLLGDIWDQGNPKWEAALANPNLSLHLYGKNTARPGRKMGHVSCLAQTSQQAASEVDEARSCLASLAKAGGFVQATC